jgi:hypothetical protein
MSTHVRHRLATTRLLDWEMNFEAETLQHRDRGQSNLRIELIDVAGDEQTDAHLVFSQRTVRDLAASIQYRASSGSLPDGHGTSGSSCFGCPIQSGVATNQTNVAMSIAHFTAGSSKRPTK